MNLHAISLAGWAFIAFITIFVPWAVVRNREAALAMAWIPLADRFLAMLVPQIVLGVLALVAAWIEGVRLFPAQVPALRAWLAGAIFLAAVVAIVRPYWRRSIEDLKPTWRLFAPTSARERRMWVALSLSAGLAEEWVWRGVLPALLTEVTGSVPAAIAISIASFAVAHAIQGPRSMLAIAGIAAAFHALVLLSGSLYVAMVVHFVYDVIAGFTYERFARELGFLQASEADTEPAISL